MGSPLGSEEAGAVLGPDQYVCTLPAEVCKLAETHLKEEEQARTSAIVQMRNFISSHPLITKCRMDGNFLLRFLRMKKFRVEEAQEQLEKYLRMRQEHPQWFTKLNILDPTLDELISTGYFFALPERDESGRRVFFSVGGKMDPTRFTASDQMRSMLVGFESLIEDEENQVRGFTYIFDEKELGLSIITLWTPSDVSKAFQCCEKTIPMRHKEIHIVNLPTALMAVFEFAKTLLSDKIKNRFQMHSDNSKLRQAVPSRLLPKEYGGTVPMADMIQMYKKELLSVRSRVLMLDQMHIAKKPKNKRIDKALTTIQRNFKKLDID
ncbi:clavesin-2-like [Portunus trituberculatus]|uniref:clavesin-2-like n=1 Tax=Portunus trituberculatus TaxID=210409 RepID=UPI001E1D1E87|nr:clavesin-2-like [Portunus trituberculatus]